MSQTVRRDRTWRELFLDPAIFSWSMYDWANRSFATTVMAGFFPVFFKQFWSVGQNVNVSTYQLGNANALSSAFLAVLSPILGAVADQSSARKRLLLAFGFLGLLATASLSLVAKGEWQTAVLLYVIASIGFAGTNGFHDALIVTVARPRELAHVSALGFAFGYLGGGLLFALNVFMTLKPNLFYLRDATQAVQVSFIMVALWWAIFSVPIIFLVHEPKKENRTIRLVDLSLKAFVQVGETLKDLRRHRNLVLFLAAYFFYIDGVGTIMRMAVDYGLSLGFSSQHLIAALLMTQFIAFPAAIGYGHLSKKIGTKISLQLAIAAYVAVTIFAYYFHSSWQFYVVALVIGLFQGGIQALSRSVFAAMIPESKSGEFFGFFNMLGRFSAILGPVLMGWVSLFTGNSRISILSLILLFAIGSGILAFVSLDV